MAIFRYPNWRWPDISGALEDFERARRHMDRLLSVFTGGASSPASSGVFPPLIVTEDETRFTLKLKSRESKPKTWTSRLLAGPLR